MEQFIQHNWATISAIALALWAFWKADLFPWIKSRAAQEREAQTSLTDRLFQVLDRQVETMDDTGKLIRDMSSVLQSISTSIGSSSSLMIAKHEITHTVLRDICTRLDDVQASLNDNRELLTGIATAQGLTPRRKPARNKPAIGTTVTLTPEGPSDGTR